MTTPQEPAMGVSELLPCPFCGRSDCDQWPNESLDASGANAIRCAWCHGSAPAKTWNTRAALPHMQPAGEAVSTQPAPVDVRRLLDHLGELRCYYVESRDGVKGYERREQQFTDLIAEVDADIALLSAQQFIDTQRKSPQVRQKIIAYQYHNTLTFAEEADDFMQNEGTALVSALDAQQPSADAGEWPAGVLARDRTLEILRQHNEWRRGADTEQTDPRLLGLALDAAIAAIAAQREAASA